MKKLLIILLLFTGCKKSESQEVRLNKPYSIICDGNSIVEGYPLLNGSYAKYITKDLNIPIRNLGIGGYSTTQLIDTGARIDRIQHLDTNYILVLDEGRNDIYKGAQGIEAYENYKTYCAARKAHNPNLKIVLCIPTPSAYVDPIEMTILRMALIDDFKKTRDTLIYTDSYYADILVDLQSDSLIGYSTAYNDYLYYCDLIHHTEFGSEVRAKNIERGIKLLLNY